MSGSDRLTPSASVIVPAYRASGHIAAALDSVFAQTFSSFEAIVVNDGSPDTSELERALAPYFSRIRYITQENRGAGAARNAGIIASRGRYIALLDADDRWRPDFLRRQVRWLDANPQCGMVYADAMIAGESPLARRTFTERAPSRGSADLLALIGQRCNIVLSTVVVRREPIFDAGLFDETLRRGQDFDLWLRLALRGVAITFQPRVLAERGVHADGLSGDAVSELERAIDVLDRFGRAHRLDAGARTALRRQLLWLVDQLEIEQGKRRLMEGNFAAARYHLNASRRRPLTLRMALLALKVAPWLVRGAYRTLRPSVWRPAPVAAR
jgi:glycosyltransferase involved in cell wall biosynthesis